LLLRASSQQLGTSAELDATVGRGGGGGIEHGEEIVRFGEAVTRGSSDVDDARAKLRGVLGDAALIDAAAIVGIFNGLVRNADFSGIPLDDGTLHASAEFRGELGLNDYAGAANTELGRADPGRAGDLSLGPRLVGPA